MDPMFVTAIAALYRTMSVGRSDGRSVGQQRVSMLPILHLGNCFNMFYDSLLVQSNTLVQNSSPRCQSNILVQHSSPRFQFNNLVQNYNCTFGPKLQSSIVVQILMVKLIAQKSESEMQDTMHRILCIDYYAYNTMHRMLCMEYYKYNTLQRILRM